MPKMKTKRAAAKRFRIKASGKIKFDHANHEHISTKKTRNRKNRLKKTGIVNDANKFLIMGCLPNG